MSFISNPVLGRQRLLGQLLGANMNSTSDQAIPINSAAYRVTKIVVANASLNLTTAAGGVYPTTAKGGTAIVAAAQIYTALSSGTKLLDLTIANADKQTAANLYLSLTTAQGSAATADIFVFGEDIA